MSKLSKVITTPPLISAPPPIKGLISDLSSDTKTHYAISKKPAKIANALQNQPSNTGFMTVLPTFALMYRHTNVASVQYHSAQLKHVPDMATMRGQVERTEQLLTKAWKENILLVEELRLKSEQLKVIAYDDEQAQTLQQNRCLQEQLDLAKTKYDVVHSKLDKSVVIYNQERAIW